MYVLKGINLIELLAVLAIIVILNVIAIPSMVSFTQKYRVTATAQNLYYALQYARSEAVKRNQSVYVTFNSTDPWCYGINPVTPCSCSTPSGCSLGTGGASKAQDMTLTSAGLTSNSLIFEGTRGATTSGKTTLNLTLYGGTLAMSVAITALGNMQLCSSTISGYPVCT